ncbi:MAG: hypothetical protein P8Z41_12145, partial [Anaerolineales bacterium]
CSTRILRILGIGERYFYSSERQHATSIVLPTKSIYRKSCDANRRWIDEKVRAIEPARIDAANR